LLDLLLSQLLINHFLLGWEVVLFNLLTTTFNLQLVLITLHTIFIFLVAALLVLFVHFLTILFICLLLHLGGLLKHEELLLLLLS